ncbi:MAG: DUF2892 domain-containing protein [Bacteroidetes bacterium]|nr:DUF2892 domain-containing protein [Bacteroidota bacterium]
MKQNMGTTDKIVRIVLAIILGLLYFNDVVIGVAGIALMVLAVVFLATSLVGFCPLYTLVGVNTCPKEKVKG